MKKYNVTFTKKLIIERTFTLEVEAGDAEGALERSYDMDSDDAVMVSDDTEDQGNWTHVDTQELRGE